MNAKDKPQDPEKLQKELMEMMHKMAASSKVETEPEATPSGEDAEVEKKKKRHEVLQFDLKPKDIKKYLDRFVIKQDEAKRVLATTICDHYNHIKSCRSQKTCADYVKQNVVMLGPTGVGKTYLIKIIADKIGVPFVKADATKFSETGYVGQDVDDLARDLVQKADGDIELAQYGIIYIDEIDKIASTAQAHVRDVSGSGVQRGLLKIMEETEISLRNPQDMQAQIQAMIEYQRKGKITKPMMNTKHVLFIVSGAFVGLADITAERLQHSRIGFSTEMRSKEKEKDMLQRVRTEDFVKYGYEPEFIGRLPVRVICDDLSDEDLYMILKTSEGSLIKQYQAALKAYDIDLTFEDRALWNISKRAALEKTGARGLVTVFEKVFRGLKYELPSTHIKEFHLSHEIVDNPAKGLKVLLKSEHDVAREEITAEIKRFEMEFLKKNELRIRFEEEASQAVVERILDGSLGTQEFLTRLLSNYHYGLKLIQQKTRQKEFVLPREAVSNPNGVLDRWIKEVYE